MRAAHRTRTRRSDVIQYVLFGFVVAAMIAAGVLASQATKRRMAAAAALARSRGFEFDPASKEPPPLPFNLFQLGSSRRVSYHTWRPGSSDSMFQYRYTTGSGKNRHTHHRSCVLVEVPFTAPHLTIGPEGFWSAVGRAIGVRDVEVESPDFNRRYRVSCDDDRFAITLLDHEMIAWMLSPNSGGGTVKFEFGGRWMLCWGDRIEYPQLFGFLEWAQHARDVLPDVLTSLYPPR
jgi:hypothetical protein